MRPVTNAKIVTAILIPIILMSIASYGYAHWTDSVTKKYKIHVRCTYTKIKTNKVLTDWVDDKFITKIPSDTELEATDGTYALSISTNQACPGFDVWIGLMLHNQGFLPERVYPPTFSVTAHPPNSVSYKYSNFTYGIFSEGDFTNYYGRINRQNFRDLLKPDVGLVGETPIYLPQVIKPCEKLVIWIYIELLDGPPQFTLEIAISVNTELA